MGRAGVRRRKPRRRLKPPSSTPLVPPVAYGFSPQGGMGALAAFVGTLRALGQGNEQQRRNSAALLSVAFGMIVMIFTVAIVAALLR